MIKVKNFITSQKKIYNKRSILNLGIRKSALNRIINSLNFDISLKLCMTYSYLMGLKKRVILSFFLVNIQLCPHQVSLFCEKWNESPTPP